MIRFTLALALFFFSLSGFASDTPFHYRFWQGYKRNTWVKPQMHDGHVVRDADGYKQFENDPDRKMTWLAFRTLINRWLIPATISCCSETSLIAYLPVILAEGPKANLVPDEIALIIYQSEEAYKKTRADKSNREAITYGPLHGDVFDLGNTKSLEKSVREHSSRSLVAAAFELKIDLTPDDKNNQLPERAYDVLGKKIDWQTGYNRVRVIPFSPSDNLQMKTKEVEAYATALQKQAPDLGLRGYILVVTERAFFEFQNWENEASWNRFLPTTIQVELVKALGNAMLNVAAAPKCPRRSSDQLLYESLNFKEAGNIQFEVGKKTRLPAKHPRLE